MNSNLVWDLPTRLFHWLLSAGFFVAAAIAFLLDDDSPLYPWHSMIGLVLAFMVVLRVVWGFIGTKHARFGSFAHGPGAVLDYFKGILAGRDTRHAGHNPGSAYAIFGMLALVMGLAVTGVMTSRGNHDAKEVHEVLAYVLLAFVAAHVAGVLVHTIRLRENIILGMVTGRKSVEDSEAIPSARPVTGVIFAALVVAWGWGVVGSYNPATRTMGIPVLGISVQVGENEGGRGEGRAPRGWEGDED